jgi:D-alanyl-D-alanine carboxypeptidase
MSGNDRTGEWGTKLTQKSSNLRGSARVALGIVSVLAITTAILSPAEARHYRARVMTHGHDYSPPSSAIVVDANSGNVLYAASPDELRHPASLTKIMTLYLLFERLEAGKLKLDSQLSVSEHASGQAPTKLGLKPGQTIAVEDAIKGLVTKSANDAAVVVSEAIGGTESDFAEMMTKKARALGMSHTVYRNASGLPNDEQVTTARDQALLGRAIQERFPSQYRYFSTLSFTYHGESMRNHNMLLGHVEGVDGIKTGYTQASGFNLVTSVHRNNRHIVAVVLGGASAGARDAKMRSLIEAHIASASTQHTAPAIAEGAAAKVATRTAATKAPATYSVASFSPPTALPASKFVPVAPAENALTAAAPPANGAAKAPASAKPATAVDANDTIRPIHVKTIKVKLTPTQTAGLGPIVSPARDEHAESGAQPAPPAVTAPPPRAPAPKAAAIAPPVAAPAAAAPVAAAPVAAAPMLATAHLAAAPVVAAPPDAAVAAPVAPTSVSVPKTAPVAAYAAPPTAAPVAAPPVAAAAVPVAPASVVAPKTAPVAAYAAAPAAAPVAAPAVPVAPISVSVPKTAPVAAYAAAPTAAPVAAPPVAAAAVPVAPASIVVPKTAPVAAYAAAPAAAPVPVAPTSVSVPKTAPVAAYAAAPAATPVAPMAAPVASASNIVPKTVAGAPSPVAPARMAAAPVMIATAPAAAEANAPESKRDVAARSAPTHTGWIVQVGAFDVERDAQQRLTIAHAKLGHALDNADPFTEPVMKGDKTFYRARFAGFQQKDEADAVCKQLKRNDIDCMTIRN